MNKFVIKFHRIIDESKLYKLLEHLSSGYEFIPFDSETFVIKTDYTKEGLISMLLQSSNIAKNFFCINASSLDENSFFIDNEIEQDVIENFAQSETKYASSPDGTLSKKEKEEMLNSLLDNFDNLSEEDRKKLDNLSQL